MNDLVMNGLYGNYNISTGKTWAEEINWISKYCNIAVNEVNAAQQVDICALQEKINALEAEIKELKELLRSTTTLVLTLAGNEKIKELKESKLKNE